MKILFCSKARIKAELGCSKNAIELAEELEHLDWKCKLIGSDDIVEGQKSGTKRSEEYHENLRQYLRLHAAEYDVVLYEHACLPYPREEFCSKTLFVARPALLFLHLQKISIPKPKTLKYKIGSLIKKSAREKKFTSTIQTSLKSLKSADLVQALNYDDKSELTEHGIAEEKIAVVPNGISRDRRVLFDAVSCQPPEKPKVAFVGTFDFRKGANDFPKIVQSICQKLPETTFRLLGTAGLFETKEQVLSFFPKHLRQQIEVIPHFAASELPELLASCSVGIFPSYLEGFGFGVLEMLSASIPVIAYDAPGPPMMLSKDYLVSPGDTKVMSNKVVSLLQNREKLLAARIWSKEQSQKFCWQKIANQVNQIYLEHLSKK